MSRRLWNTAVAEPKRQNPRTLIVEQDKSSDDENQQPFADGK